MCLEDIKIAQSRESRATNDAVGNGATVTILGRAANRVLARFALTSGVGAIGNLEVFIQYVGDSGAVGVGMLTGGHTFIELSLEKHSDIISGPFQAANSSGFAVVIGAIEVLQNKDPESFL